MCADGSLVHFGRGDEDFDGAVVALGALGLVVRVSLDVVPEFELRQYVFERLPWATVEEHLQEMLAFGYSTSLFTLWTEAGIDQVWVKSTEPVDTFFGATAAEGPRHPIAGADTANSHRTARRTGSVGGTAAALPPRLHAERRR